MDTSQFKRGRDIIWTRKKGKLNINVHHYVGIHGFDIGNSGEAVDELALNILLELFPPHLDSCLPYQDGFVSEIAWKNRISLKFDLLADVGKQRGRIKWVKIKLWLKRNHLELHETENIHLCRMRQEVTDAFD